MFDSPAAYTDESMDDNVDLNDWQYCQRYFHTVPVSNKKIVYIDPKLPHYLYSPNRKGEMKCVTAHYFLKDKEPHFLFNSGEIQQCRGTPRGNHANHTHNPRDEDDTDTSGGPTPDEIGLMYFKWAMRIKCAEPTCEYSFAARTELAKKVRKYMLQYNIPHRSVVRPFFRTFNREKLQRSTESVNKKCTQKRRVFPDDTLKIIDEMRFNYCGWNNTLVAPVNDGPSEEERSDDEDPGDSEGALANPEEAMDFAQPGPSAPPPSPAESNHSGFSDVDDIPRTPGRDLNILLTPIRTSTPASHLLLQTTPNNNPLPELLGDLFTPQGARDIPTEQEMDTHREVSVWDNGTIKTFSIPRGRGYIITGVAGEPNTITVQLTTNVPEQRGPC